MAFSNNTMKENNDGAQILLEAHSLVTGDRQKVYGHPSDDYLRVVTIFESLTGIKLSVREALLFMVSVKLSRLRNNFEKDILHHDTLVDVMGYMACINMVQQKTTQEKENINVI